MELVAVVRCGPTSMIAFDEFDLYFVNVRGQGESPMKVGLPDLEGAVQDVDAILSYFQLDKVILVGHLGEEIHFKSTPIAIQKEF